MTHLREIHTKALAPNGLAHSSRLPHPAQDTRAILGGLPAVCPGKCYLHRNIVKGQRASVDVLKRMHITLFLITAPQQGVEAAEHLQRSIKPQQHCRTVQGCWALLAFAVASRSAFRLSTSRSRSPNSSVRVCSWASCLACSGASGAGCVLVCAHVR